MILEAYRLATRLCRPLALRIIDRRAKAGKEDPARLHERLGAASLSRPGGRLLWFHAASVGESVSALRLIERLLARDPALHILITSGTVTSAALLQTRLPPRAFHQYAPIDIPDTVRRFLDHWRPDLALWMESEMWPNLILQTRRRGIPMLLINGRMSRRSYRRWRLTPGAIRRLLSCFDLCLTQSESEQERFRALGARHAQAAGNLKWAAAPLPHGPEVLADLKQRVKGRPLWLAGSTRPGEESVIAEAHRRLKTEFPKLLTIIAPRHPARGASIADSFRQAGLKMARRAVGEAPGADDEIYLADTMGELGLFYRLAEIVFIGGSLVAHGGHNPIEPAQLDCAILAGPHTGNFTTIMAAFDAGGGLSRVRDAGSLSDAVGGLMRDGEARRAAAGANRAVVAARQDVLDQVIGQVSAYLPAPSPQSEHAPA